MSHPDLVGIKEIAERLGVKENTVSIWRWRSRNGALSPAMPDPDFVVSGNPVWYWRTISKWAGTFS